MNLKEILENYKQISLKAIDTLHEDKFDELLNLIEQREKMISKIKAIEYNKEEFVKLVSNLNLTIIEQELSKYINSKKIEMKTKMQVLDRKKNASASYNVYQKKAMLFSKKI